MIPSFVTSQQGAKQSGEYDYIILDMESTLMSQKRGPFYADQVIMVTEATRKGFAVPMRLLQM